MGRKDWLFSDTVQGAQASALNFSLIETAKSIVIVVSMTFCSMANAEDTCNAEVTCKTFRTCLETESLSIENSTTREYFKYNHCFEEAANADWRSDQSGCKGKFKDIMSAFSTAHYMCKGDCNGELSCYTGGMKSEIDVLMKLFTNTGNCCKCANE